MATITEISSSKCFGGLQKIFSHTSQELKCKLNFGVYLPAEAVEKKEKLPVLYWLSGLTCTEQNFIQKSGFQRFAAKYKIIVVNPDTSPRECNIEGESDNWDFGTGAGFYVDATEAKWKNNYRMFSYVTKEIPELVNANFPVSGKQSVFGHSMGGHGALICGLKMAGFYTSVSAFAPICNPIEAPWGKKAFSGYLGSENKSAWAEYDACELMKKYKGTDLHILIDQGDADNHLSGDNQLLPTNFEAACKAAGKSVQIRMQPGYDHGYFFIATFIEDHFEHHAKFLKA